MAFLLVFLHHSWRYRYDIGDWPVVRHGYWGVTIFFVLSGFLIGRILLDLRDDRTSSLGSRLKVFYARRALRIFPIFYLVILALIVLRAAGLLPEIPDWEMSPGWHLTYLTNIAMALIPAKAGSEVHFWSLCIEEHFYFVAPIVVLTLRQQSLERLCIGLWIGIAAARIGIQLAHLPGPLWALSPMHFDTMSVGIAAALAERNGNFAGISPKTIERAGLVCGLGFCLAILHRYRALPLGEYWFTLLAQWMCAVATAGLVLRLWRAEGTLLGHLFGFRPFAELGKISYALYLLHPYVLAVVPGDGNSVKHGVTAFVITVAISALSWRFFEGPINDLKRHFSYRQQRSVEATAGAS